MAVTKPTVRTRLGLSDYSEKFSWAYWLYNEQTLRPTRLARWLIHEGERIKVPRVGAVALLAEPDNAARGTVTDQGLICIAPGSRVVCIPVERVSAHYFWVD